MPCLLVHTCSEAVLQTARRLCDKTGWTVAASPSREDASEAGPGCEAALLDLVQPAEGVEDLARRLSAESAFLPLIFISAGRKSSREMGEGLRYHIQPGHLDDLEHILISLTFGFPSREMAGPAQAEPRRTPRVLIVDDNVQLASAIERALRALERLDVRVVGSGFEAASVLPMFRPDVIVVDLVLGDMDGREVCTLVRRTLQLKDARIIGISGYLPESRADEQAGAPGLGLFDAFIEKPFRVQEIVERVISFL